MSHFIEVWNVYRQKHVAYNNVLRAHHPVTVNYAHIDEIIT